VVELTPRSTAHSLDATPTATGERGMTTEVLISLLRMASRNGNGMAGDAARLSEQEAEIKRLREALKPFSDAVYNDNGDVTITHPDCYAYMRAQAALKTEKET
jgi:hypothetical protein